MRRYDAEKRELDIDFVRHGVGVAATWAYRAQPGDVMHIGGPSASLGLPDGFDWLFVVAEPAHRQDLRELPGVEATWVHREGSDAASSPLMRAIDADSAEDPCYERFHEQSELLSALAIRLAIGLGIGELISRGVTMTAALAARTGTVEQALGKLPGASGPST